MTTPIAGTPSILLSPLLNSIASTKRAGTPDRRLKVEKGINQDRYADSCNQQPGRVPPPPMFGNMCHGLPPRQYTALPRFESAILLGSATDLSEGVKGARSPSGSN